MSRVQAEQDDFNSFEDDLETQLTTLTLGTSDNGAAAAAFDFVAATEDNTDLIRGPVPPENTFQVNRVPYEYLRKITANFAHDDAGRFLGKGGFAEVYLGVTERSNLKLAVKWLTNQEDRSNQV